MPGPYALNDSIPRSDVPVAAFLGAGDLLVGTGTPPYPTYGRLAAGLPGQVLLPDPTVVPLGLVWTDIIPRPKTFQSSAVADIPVTVKGFAGQTGLLTRWLDSTGATVAEMTADGRLGVGAANAGGATTVLYGSRDDQTIVTFQTFHDTANRSPRLLLRRARGTAALPTPVALGSYVGQVQFNGRNTAGTNVVGAEIRGEVAAALGATDMPTRLAFHTTKTGGALAERGSWDAPGNLLVGPTASPAGGERVVALQDRAVAPTANPAGGSVLYSEAGEVWARTVTGPYQITPPSTGGGVPYFVAFGDTFTVPEFTQALFAMTIDNEGTVDNEGYLIGVD